jgi:glyoxylase-like metal-dependent hydrolase (beta-lactamase superfamily II)
VICAWRIGDVIVDPGPASCVERLLGAIDADPPRVLALTHIHLDHAGAAGTLARRYPELEVWVHELGALHVIDPSRLLASAGRLYGDDMQRLWGEVLPVPEERVRVLYGGEQMRGLQCAYTPGHAVHHVAYMHAESGTAFTGDVAGVRMGSGPALPPTPPPDIDVPAWLASLEVLEAWDPQRLALTHFGMQESPREHIAELRRALADAERWARELGSDGFAAAVRERVAAEAPPQDAAAYEQAMSPQQSYEGLRRYIERAR